MEKRAGKVILVCLKLLLGIDGVTFNSIRFN